MSPRRIATNDHCIDPCSAYANCGLFPPRLQTLSILIFPSAATLLELPIAYDSPFQAFGLGKVKLRGRSNGYLQIAGIRMKQVPVSSRGPQATR